MFCLASTGLENMLLSEANREPDGLLNSVAPLANMLVDPAPKRLPFLAGSPKREPEGFASPPNNDLPPSAGLKSPPNRDFPPVAG